MEAEVSKEVRAGGGSMSSLMPRYKKSERRGEKKGRRGEEGTNEKEIWKRGGE